MRRRRQPSVVTGSSSTTALSKLLPESPCAPLGRARCGIRGTRGCAALHPGLSTSPPMGPQTRPQPCRRHGRGQPGVERSATPGGHPRFNGAPAAIPPQRGGRGGVIWQTDPTAANAPPRAIDLGPDGAAGTIPTMPKAWTWTARGGAERNPGGAPPVYGAPAAIPPQRGGRGGVIWQTDPTAANAPPRAIDLGPDGAADTTPTMPKAWTWTARGGAERNPGGGTPGLTAPPPPSRPNGADGGVGRKTNHAAADLSCGSFTARGSSLLNSRDKSAAMV